MRSRTTKPPAPEHRSGRHEAADPPSTTGLLAWYRWYIGDHLRVTRGWPLVARAVYHDLLDAQWDRGSLPAAPEQLRELVAGCTRAEWKLAWPYIEAEFPLHEHGRQNPPLAAQRTAQMTLAERCRRGGLEGSRLRWGRPATVVPLRPPGGDEDA
jgi:hypothetical protein